LSRQSETAAEVPVEAGLRHRQATRIRCELQPGGPACRSFTIASLQSAFWLHFLAMIAAVDTNIWGFLAVPVGVLLCFGPALFVWIKNEYISRPPDDRRGGS